MNDTVYTPDHSRTPAHAADAPRSLDGIRIIDLSRVIAGPLCGALLGDMGADVIKIEDTSAGDESRTWPPLKEGESAGYLVNNRNKRNISVDLKAEEGAQLARDLIRGADVVIENFRSGAMERFGLGYEALAALNPRLIYCSVSAFGRTGPRAAEGGYEAMMQAFSGIMSITGEPGQPPVRAGVSVLDVMTGTLAAYGVVNALLFRERTGLGQRVDGSLLDTAVSLLNFQAQGHLLTGVVPSPMGSAHPSLSPYRIFRCKDDRWIFVAAANDRLWSRLVRALDVEALGADPRFATNQQRVAHRAELESQLEQVFARHDSAEIHQRLQQADVPATPVNNVAQVLKDPQIASRPVLQRMKHPRLGDTTVLGLPLAFSAMPTHVRRHAPARGEHTDEILRELGYDDARIASLRERRIVR